MPTEADHRDREFEIRLQSWETNQLLETDIRQFEALGTLFDFVNFGNDQLLLLLGDGDSELSFFIFDGDFNLVAPAVLEQPSIVSTTIITTASISVTWSPVAGAAAYLVERRESDEGEWAPIAEVEFDQISHLDSSLVPSSIFQYRVTAINGDTRSLPSATAEVEFEVPGPVENFEIGIDSTTATVMWDPISNAQSYDLEFTLLSSNSRRTSTIGDSGETEGTVTNLQSNSRYEFRVRGRNLFGVGPWNIQLIRTLPRLPVTPSSLRTLGNVFSFSVPLFWNRVADATHRVERLNLEGSWQTIFLGTSTSFTDFDVEPSTSYNYRVRSENILGESDFSDPITVTTPSLSPPSSPSVNTVTISEAGLDVEYRLNDPTATEVTVERSVGNENDWAEISTFPVDQSNFPLGVLSFTDRFSDSTTVPGFVYSYRIFASNSAGSSTPSGSRSRRAIDAVCILEEDFEGAEVSPFLEIKGADIITDGGQGFPAGGSVAWFGNAFERSLTASNLPMENGGTLVVTLRFGNSEVDGEEFWETPGNGESISVQFNDTTATADIFGSPTAGSTTIPVETEEAFVTYTINIPESENLSVRLIQQNHDGPGLDVFAIDSLCILAHRPVNQPPVVSDQFVTSYSSPLGAPLAIDLSEFVTDTDPLDTLYFSIEETSNPGLFERFDVDLLTGLLELQFAPFLTGSSTLLLSFSDSAGATISQEITITVPPFDVPTITREGAIELNPTTGLFEQSITISNNGSREIAGFDLVVTGLNADFVLFGQESNRVSSDEIFSPGESRTIVLEYHSPTSGIEPRPDFEVQVLERELDNSPVSIPLEAALQTLRDSSVVFNFSATIGASYAIEYSSDMVTWVRSPAQVTAGSNWVTWLDQGLPKTNCHPSDCPTRYYRAVLLSED